MVNSKELVNGILSHIDFGNGIVKEYKTKNIEVIEGVFSVKIEPVFPDDEGNEGIAVRLFLDEELLFSVLIEGFTEEQVKEAGRIAGELYQNAYLQSSVEYDKENLFVHATI